MNREMRTLSAASPGKRDDLRFMHLLHEKMKMTSYLHDHLDAYSW